jgi:hypothetical protein
VYEPLSEALNEPLNPVDDINLRLAVAAADIAELRAEVARLDRALEESRRLNKRASEVLELVYEHLANDPQPAPQRAWPRATVTGPTA